MKISIIGAAGSVGSPAAFYLASQKLADEILMIGGRNQNVLKQHAMDLGTAVSSRNVKVYAGSYDDMRGSDIVLIAAGVPQGHINDRMELLPKNTELMKQFAEQIKRYCPNATIITATNPADPMNYAVFLAGQFDRKKVIGYTLNDTYRFREFLAKSFKVEVCRVGGYVTGEHGSSQVLLFSTAEIDGKPVTISDSVKKDIYAEIPLILKQLEEFKAGRTAGWTCAIGFETMVRAMVQDTGQMIPCSIVLDGEYGQNGFSMSVPVILGKGGVMSVKEFKLANDEHERFQKTTEVLKHAAGLVENYLNQ